MTKPTIVLADEQAMMCDMAARVLQPEFAIANVVRDGPSLLAAAQLSPDVVVLDLSLPLGGVQVIRKVLRASPNTKVIVLTMISDSSMVREALAAGAAGYLLKTGSLHELSDAIREVLRGNLYVTSALALALTEKDGPQPNRALTERERQVLALLADGKPMRVIAAILALTPRTIAFHKYRIMKKLGARSSAELIRVAVARSLVS